VLQPFAWALMAGQFAHGRMVVQSGAFVGVGVGFALEHVRFSSLIA
jgi:hypothetical protein